MFRSLVPFEFVIEMCGEDVNGSLVGGFEFFLVEVSEVEVDDVIVDVFPALQGSVVVCAHRLTRECYASRAKQERKKVPVGCSFHSLFTDLTEHAKQRYGVQDLRNMNMSESENFRIYFLSNPENVRI